MKKMELEVFSDAVNSPVVRFPGRKFPGVLMQGDSLKALLAMAQEIGELARNSDQEEIQELSSELEGSLKLYLSVYEETLRVHKMEFPYPV